MYCRFEPSLSAGDPSATNVTTLNIALLYVAAAVERQLAPWQSQLVLPWVWQTLGETLFVTMPVQALLWGYYEPMVALAIEYVRALYPNVTLDLDPYIGLFKFVCRLIGQIQVQYMPWTRHHFNELLLLLLEELILTQFFESYY